MARTELPRGFIGLSLERIFLGSFKKMLRVSEYLKSITNSAMDGTNFSRFPWKLKQVPMAIEQ